MKASVYAAAGFALATTGLASGQQHLFTHIDGTAAGGGAGGGGFVIDQIGDDLGTSLTGGIRAAQYFTAANSAFNIAALDDFTLGDGLTVTSIEAVLSGFAGYTDKSLITAYQVNIYSSPGAAALDLVGDVFSMDFVTPTSQFDYPVVIGDGTTTNVQFDVSMELAGGTYWVSVIPSNSFGDNGQTGIAGSSLQSGFSGAFQANPNGGFGFDGNLSPVEDTNMAADRSANPCGIKIGLVGSRMALWDKGWHARRLSAGHLYS